MLILMFIIGTIFGSFYNVVGYRIPKEESIIYPPSHCPKCNHKLKFYELIPVISYIIQKGKCTKCKEKIGLFYPVFELITGIMFSLSYLIYGYNAEIIIVLTFISMLIIITISDVKYMIIPDNVLLFFTTLLLIEIGIIKGITSIPLSLLNGILSFTMMFLIKKFGDLIFKKESMGGGDIKLMFVIGMVLSLEKAILNVFLASLIGLPISIILMKNNKTHIVPFGPLLSISACILILTKININDLLNLFP